MTVREPPSTRHEAAPADASPVASACVVVGGALVGSACALALARAGMTVTMLDDRPAVAPSSVSDMRPIALAAASQRILDHLGIWEALAPECQPIHAVHVSRRGHLGRVRILATDYGLPALGYVSDAASIHRVLDRALAGEVRIARHRAVTVTALQAVGDAVRVHTDNGFAVPPTSLVVLASGARAALTKRHGDGGRRYDYGQHAVVCNVATAGDHSGVAYERFLSTGPLALLPLPDGRSGVVWTLPSEQARALASAADAQFIHALQDAFGRRLGDFEGVSPRGCFALTLSTSAQIAGPRTVLIGNAANQLHPVAGQGLNLGLRDVATLAELLADVRSSCGDPGAGATLDRYQALRRAGQRLTVAFTHLLAKGFATAFAPLAAFGSTAMLGVQLVPGVRRMLARHATGLAPPVPRAARGSW